MSYRVVWHTKSSVLRDCVSSVSSSPSSQLLQFRVLNQHIHNTGITTSGQDYRVIQNVNLSTHLIANHTLFETHKPSHYGFLNRSYCNITGRGTTSQKVLLASKKKPRSIERKKFKGKGKKERTSSSELNIIEQASNVITNSTLSTTTNQDSNTTTNQFNTKQQERKQKQEEEEEEEEKQQQQPKTNETYQSIESKPVPSSSIPPPPLPPNRSSINTKQTLDLEPKERRKGPLNRQEKQIIYTLKGINSSLEIAQNTVKHLEQQLSPEELKFFRFIKDNNINTEDTQFTSDLIKIINDKYHGITTPILKENAQSSIEVTENKVVAKQLEQDKVISEMAKSIDQLKSKQDELIKILIQHEKQSRDDTKTQIENVVNSLVERLTSKERTQKYSQEDTIKQIESQMEKMLEKLLDKHLPKQKPDQEGNINNILLSKITTIQQQLENKKQAEVNVDKQQQQQLDQKQFTKKQQQLQKQPIEQQNIEQAPSYKLEPQQQPIQVAKKQAQEQQQVETSKQTLDFTAASLDTQMSKLKELINQRVLEKINKPNENNINNNNNNNTKMKEEEKEIQPSQESTTTKPLSVNIEEQPNLSKHSLPSLYDRLKYKYRDNLFPKSISMYYTILSTNSKAEILDSYYRYYSKPDIAVQEQQQQEQSHTQDTNHTGESDEEQVEQSSVKSQIQFILGLVSAVSLLASVLYYKELKEMLFSKSTANVVSIPPSYPPPQQQQQQKQIQQQRTDQP